MKIKIYLAFLVFFLGLSPSQASLEKDQKTANSVTRAISGPVLGRHREDVERLLQDMGISFHMHRHLTTDEKRHLAIQLAHLYQRNMDLISRFEPDPKTPHMDPKDWAKQKLEEWSKNPAVDEEEDEGIASDNEQQPGQARRIIQSAQNEMKELIKDNEALERAYGQRGLQSLHKAGQ